MKQYRQDNIDKCKERDQQYYQCNKQELLEQVKQYQEKIKRVSANEELKRLCVIYVVAKSTEGTYQHIIKQENV